MGGTTTELFLLKNWLHSSSCSKGFALINHYKLRKLRCFLTEKKKNGILPGYACKIIVSDTNLTGLPKHNETIFISSYMFLG